MSSIRLSSRQVKEADRVGGIELMILWPPELGPEPQLGDDCEREATPAEKAHAEALVRESCAQHRLLPVHVRVARVQRPTPPPDQIRPGEFAAHLAVTIIGYRWVHASTRRIPRVMFSAAPTKLRWHLTYELEHASRLTDGERRAVAAVMRSRGYDSAEAAMQEAERLKSTLPPHVQALMSVGVERR